MTAKEQELIESIGMLDSPCFSLFPFATLQCPLRFYEQSGSARKRESWSRHARGNRHAGWQSTKLLWTCMCVRAASSSRSV